MSNPYAPPEDRRRPADDEPGAPGPGTTGAADPTAGPTGLPTEPPQHALHPSPVVPGEPVPAGADPRPVVPTDPAGADRARHAARLFALMLLAAVALSTLPTPERAVALPFVVAAAVYGVRGLVLGSRAHVRGGLVPMLAGGVALSVVWALYLGAMALIWPVLADREECMAGALTTVAVNECAQTFDHDVAKLRERAQG